MVKTTPKNRQYVQRRTENAGGKGMKLKDLLKDAYKEGMTVEEINAALAEVEFPVDQTAEVERLKNALSKSNSEKLEYPTFSLERTAPSSEDEGKTDDPSVVDPSEGGMNIVLIIVIAVVAVAVIGGGVAVAMKKKK